MPHLPRPTDEAPRGRSAWPIAIVLGLALVVVANAAFIWIAVANPDPISPSYLSEQR